MDGGGRTLLATVLILAAVVTLHPQPADASASCSSSGSRYESGSPYEANLRRAADTLPTNASSSPSLFAVATVGDGSNQTVHAVGLCRGDLGSSSCLICLNAGFQDARVFCANYMDVSTNYENCHMRFSNLNFLTSTNNTDRMFSLGSSRAVASAAAGRFYPLVTQILDATVDYAAAGSQKRFATGEMDVDSAYSGGQFANIFTLAQCTPDLTTVQCRACLAGAMAEMSRQVFSANSTGGSVYGDRCGLRFDPFSFYDGEPMVRLQVLPQGRKKTTKTYIIASTSSILVLCLLFFSFLLGYKKYKSRKKSKETPRIESFLQKNRAVNLKRYTYAQVKRMTKFFAEKLGQGGYGVVYRGGFSDGRQIAVKMLKDSKADVEEFMNEVTSISRTSHVNIVTLLGFCLEGSKRALIYDYMPNGSLERYAFNRNSKCENTLSWEKLFDIAVGIARGLEYLHRGCNTRIVHFDIKPHNILLDQDFCPKISDFGLARLYPNKESVISISGARGTIGYIAPEVFSKQFGAVSSKSDVYSYGMMVLEMVGARDKNINANSECSSQYFPQWIYEHLDEYCVSASEINGESREIVRKMIVVGLWCIQLSPTNRPTMTRVIEMLEGSTSGL